MAQWNNISAGIVALLQANLTNVKSANILNYSTASLPGYPAITVTPSDMNAVVGDIARNERTYIFSVKVYQERSKVGESQSEATMRTLVDEIIALLDANKFLDNNRLSGMGWVRPIPSAWRYAQGEQIDIRVAEILLAATVIE